MIARLPGVLRTLLAPPDLEKVSIDARGTSAATVFAAPRPTEILRTSADLHRGPPG